MPINTKFYNYNEKTFRAGPDLIVARRSHTCSMLKTNHGSYVVVGGGYYQAALDSTEYLALDEPITWRKGENNYLIRAKMM